MALSASVVIPTYNAAAFIRQTVESVYRQSRLPAEIVVVDDASTDGTPDLVRALSRSSPVPIRIIRLTQNSGGPAHPLNIGAEEARHEIIVPLDQDDQMACRRVELQLGFLIRVPHCGLVTGLWVDTNADGVQISGPVCDVERYRAIKHSELTELGLMFDGGALYEELVHCTNFLMGASTIAFKRAAWERVGRFCEHVRCVWDYDFALRAASFIPVGMVEAVVNFKRAHSGNLTNNAIVHWREMRVHQYQHLSAPLMPLNPVRVKRSLQSLQESFLGLGYHESVAGAYRNAANAFSLARKAGCPRRAWGIGLSKLACHAAVQAMGFGRARDVLVRTLRRDKSS